MPLQRIVIAGRAVCGVTGERVLQSMAWGFPLRLKRMKPDSKPRRSTTSPTGLR
jgi:hypothetical protein